MLGEHFGETFVRQIGRGGERRRKIRDTDPAERAVLPSHFDPGLDHLRERRFNTACRDGVERRHQPTSPHLVDDRRGESAHPLGLAGLGPHEFAHPTGQPDNPVGRFDYRRHAPDPNRHKSPRREFRYRPNRNSLAHRLRLVNRCDPCRSASRLPMCPLDAVVAEAGKGLVGDVPHSEYRRVIETRPTIPALLERSRTRVRRDTYRGHADRPAHLSGGGAPFGGRRALAAGQQGVGKGTRVGLFFPNGVDWIVWWLAVSRIGALAVPLSTMYKPAELAKVLRLADVGLLVAPSKVLDIDVAERFEAALPELSGQRAGQLALRAAPYLRAVVLVGGSDRGWATHVDDRGRPACRGTCWPRSRTRSPPRTWPSWCTRRGRPRTRRACCTPTARWSGRRRHGRRRSVRSRARRESARILCAMPFFWIGGVLAATGALHEPVTLLVMPRLDADDGAGSGRAGASDRHRRVARLHPAVARPPQLRRAAT